jgi:small subunit ribosomal protein S21
MTVRQWPERLGHWAINRSIEEERRMQVLVRDNNVDQALRVLKKKMQHEGVFREMKLRGHYEKPSERRVRERAEAIRRARKLARKKLQREGLLPIKPRVIPGAVGRGGPPRAPRAPVSTNR